MSIAIGNTSSASSNGSGTTIASSASVLTTGNTNIVLVRGATGSGTVTGIADTAGNKYYRIGRVIAGYTLEIWYCPNCTGHATNVVTATYGAAQTFRTICTMEVSGLGTAPAILTNDMRIVLTATTITSGQISSSQDDFLIVMAGQTSNTAQTWTPETGFTQAVQDSDHISTITYKVATAEITGSTFTLTATGAQDKGLFTIVFEATPAAEGGAGGEAFAPFLG